MPWWWWYGVWDKLLNGLRVAVEGVGKCRVLVRGKAQEMSSLAGSLRSLPDIDAISGADVGPTPPKVGESGGSAG